MYDLRRSHTNNPFGHKGNRGGAMRRKNSISIDFSVFEDYAAELDDLGANLQEIFEDVMEQEAETVQEDTLEALDNANLPAQGEYSIGTTKDNVNQHPKVEWSGSIAEVGLGFDKSKPGAGGFLITGTPRMKPDQALVEIYGRKKYQKRIQDSIMDYLQAEIEDRLGSK